MPAPFAQPASVPGLQSFIPQTPAAVTIPEAVPSPAPAVQMNGPAPPQPAGISPPAEPQLASQTSPAAEALRQRGFDIPGDWSEQKVYDTLAQQIDDANSIRDEFAPHRDEFAQWRQAQQANPSPPAAPAESAPQPQPVESGYTPGPAPVLPQPGGNLEPSSEAQMLTTQGYLTKGENGWVSSNPAFQKFADEQNSIDAQRIALLTRFSNNPDSYIEQRVQQLGLPNSETLATLQQEVADLRGQLETERSTVQEQEVDQWIDSNAAHLFVNGDRNQGYTPYAQRYNAISGQLSEMAQGMGQTLSRAQLHDNTRKFLEVEAAQQVPTPELAQQQAVQPQPFQPQPQQQSAPQSFMQQAATAPPQSTTNRLTEYPAQQPNGNNIPTGKGRLPSLAGLIDQQNRTLNPNGFPV